MAIIKCPECGTEVSDKAEKCPKCSFPISKQMVVEKVQTIEQTSKGLKKQLIFAVLSVIIGIIALGVSGGSSGGSFFGGALIFIGIIWLIVAKIRIWWNHK